MDVIMITAGIVFFCAVSIGVVTWFISLVMHFTRGDGLHIHPSIPKVTGAVLGLGLFLFFLFRFLTSYGHQVDDLPTMVTITLMMQFMAVSGESFFIIAPLLLFFGGWGIGQIIDWLRGR